MQPWSDTNRFSQSGYSSPTVFPQAENYTDLTLYAIDLAKAEKRQKSHLDWVYDEALDAKIEYLQEREELKKSLEGY